MEDSSKILIIDDEEVIRDSCKAILAGSNYTVATAQNGTVGLELLQDFQPDLVFVDLKMPGISGFEVLDKINDYDPTIVTVVITGFATVSSAVEAMKEGAFDFLPKPFTPDEMRLITRRALEKRNLELETIALRREREMMREHFAAIVSHELKSPLGAVQQNVWALEEELSDLLTETQMKSIGRIKVRLDDLMKMIHTWLRVMSTDIDNIRDNFTLLSPAEVVFKAIESVQPHATRKGIEILPSVPESLDQVNGDEGTLVEALVNIIGNAVKYSRLDSQVLVNAEGRNGEIMISVTDSGVGIPKEDLPYIFDDFYTGKSAPKDAKGSGIGLAITKRIVEAHDGIITVESEPEKGSTFIIRLPVRSKTSPP
jgi:signal transduction histidine kinase